MFDDFCPSPTARESRVRFRRSLVAAVVMYGGTSAALVGATATVHRVAQEKETQVEFAPPPPEPPPPPVAAAPSPSPRPKARRPDLAPPDKVSDEKLKESDKPLASAGPGGPVDGFLDGAPGGTGTGASPAPPPPAAAPAKVEPLVPPVDSGRNEKPRYPAAAKRKGVEGTVVVAFDVLEDGGVANAQVVSGPPELADCVLRAVASWHFTPAHRGAERVRFRVTRKIAFRLEDE